MSTANSRTALSRLFADYGLLAVLLLLCVVCSVSTLGERRPVGRRAARIVAGKIDPSAGEQGRIVIFAGDEVYADALERLLAERQAGEVTRITGSTQQMRAALERLVAREVPISVIATTEANRMIVRDVQQESAALAGARVLWPQRYWWPAFLTRDNLLNVAKKNVVIGVIAMGMTMVIITGGIDLSVGSLAALSAVVAAWLIAHNGAKEAGLPAMLLGSLGAVGLCAAVGSFSGVMVTLFKVPPFVVTLAMMWVASGMAYIICGGRSIADVPDSYDRLGMGADLLGIPNALVLMLVIFSLGHVLMSRTTLGRHVYAIGGNRHAARLSGIRVNRVLLVVYTASGALAGLGGVMLASQFTSGSANWGRMYELYAIAAVVVGGTSLAGGEGKIFGTLIGVFTMAVVQNAMNLLEISAYAQYVVLGLIVLAVVLLDMIKRHGWRGLLTPE